MHSFSTSIHIKFRPIFATKIIDLAISLSSQAYSGKSVVEKIKFEKFVFKVGKSVILCQFIKN